MKKILIVFSSLFAFACNEKKDGAFTVEGQLKNAAVKTVYLELNSSESRPITVDSAQLGEGGSFSLTGSAPEESLFSIRTDVSPYPFAVLINDAKKITIEADLANLNQSYTVKGSEASQSILEFERKVNDHAQKIYNSKKNTR